MGEFVTSRVSALSNAVPSPKPGTKQLVVQTPGMTFTGAWNAWPIGVVPAPEILKTPLDVKDVLTYRSPFKLPSLSTALLKLGPSGLFGQAAPVHTGKFGKPGAPNLV